MSETIRSRTNRWVDGRFKDPGSNSNTRARANEEEKTPTAPAPHQLVDAFDAAVESFARQRNGSSLTNQKSKVKKPRGLAAIMLEIWLWLQFAIIILVFLWAMAKRGPKSVLGHSGHRRVSSTS